jgi:hypothetical protein
MKNTFNVLLGLVAVFGIGLGLAFGGGVLYGRTSAESPPLPAVLTPAPGGGGAAAFQGGGAGGAGAATGGSPAAGGQTGGQGGQAGGQGGQGGGQTAGVIEKIEGNTITLRTQQGTATVTLAADTDLRQTVAAQVTELKAGQTVTAQGTRGTDGTIQARSLTITPAGAGGGQGGQGGQGGGQRPQGSPTPQASPAASPTAAR